MQQRQTNHKLPPDIIQRREGEVVDEMARRSASNLSAKVEPRKRTKPNYPVFFMFASVSLSDEAQSTKPLMREWQCQDTMEL